MASVDVAKYWLQSGKAGPFSSVIVVLVYTTLLLALALNKA